MGDRRTRLRPGSSIVVLLLVVRPDFFLAETAASRVIACVHQDAKGPGDETRLPAKTADAALHLQKSFLHRVFRVGRAAKNVASEVFHARAMKRIQALVRMQIARPPARGQRRILPSRS